MLNSGKYVALLILNLALIQLPAMAQNDTLRRKNLGSDSVVVINSFVPIISDAVKQSYPPKEPDIKADKAPLKYNVPITMAPVEYPPISIKPLAINKEKPLTYPASYLKLGFGTQWSPLAELLVTGHKMSGDNEQLNYGLFFHHLSAFGQKLKNQDFMDNNAALFANFYPGKAIKIGTRLDFENSRVYYYGYNHSDTSYNKSDVRQAYNYLNLDISLSNAKPGKLGVDHESHILLSGLYDKFSQHDIGADVYTDLKKTFAGRHEVYIHAEDFFNSFANLAGTHNNNLLNVKPGYQYNSGKIKAHAAIGLAFDNGTFRPLPDLGAQWAFAPDYAIVYGGWNMELRKMTYHILEQRNPWVEDNTFTLKNTQYNSFFGGLKGTVLKGLTYDVQFAYKIINDLPLFINDTNDMRKFKVLYSPGNLKTFDIGWGVDYRVNDNLDFSFHGDYNIYSPQFEQKAWHMPALYSTFAVKYNIAQKIFLKLEVIGIGKSYARLADQVVIINGVPVSQERSLALNGTADINLGATYKFSKFFSFFAELNNLANIKYQTYYNYPTFGFNGKLGVIFTYAK